MSLADTEAYFCVHKIIMWRTILLSWFLLNYIYNLRKIAVPVDTGPIPILLGQNQYDQNSGNLTNLANLEINQNSNSSHSQINGSAAILDSYQYLTNWSELLNFLYSLFSLYQLASARNNIGMHTHSNSGSNCCPCCLLCCCCPLPRTTTTELQKMASNTAFLVSILYYTLDSPKWEYIYVNKHLLNSLVLTLDQVIVNYRRINFFSLTLHRNREVSGATINTNTDEEVLVVGNSGLEEQITRNNSANGMNNTNSSNSINNSINTNTNTADVESQRQNTASGNSRNSGNSALASSSQASPCGFTVNITNLSLTLKQYYSTALFLSLYAILNIAVTKITSKPVYPFIDWNKDFLKCVFIYSLLIVFGVPVANMYYYFLNFLSGWVGYCEGEIDIREYVFEYRQV